MTYDTKEYSPREEHQPIVLNYLTRCQAVPVCPDDLQGCEEGTNTTCRMFLGFYSSLRRRREKYSAVDSRYDIEEESNFEGPPNVNVAENTTNCTAISLRREVVNIEGDCTHGGIRKPYPT